MRSNVLLTTVVTLVVGMFSSMPQVKAQSASFAGSATVVNPSTLTSTISGERVVSRGREFVDGQTFVVTVIYPSPSEFNGPPNGEVRNGPSFGDVPLFTPMSNDSLIDETVSVVISELSLGVLDTQNPEPTASFTAAAARALNEATNGNPMVITSTEAITAIIRAGAGVDGLE